METLYQAGKKAAAAGMDLKAAMAHTRQSMDPIFGHVFIYEHRLPFVWTAERGREMWDALQG